MELESCFSDNFGDMNISANNTPQIPAEPKVTSYELVELLVYGCICGIFCVVGIIGNHILYCVWTKK